ncbi:MAG: DUF3943 domain-containing protein [bacterium]|nr:DUF3943 domain-containing protein [bacterium]
MVHKSESVNKWGSVNLPNNLNNGDFIPWESEKHFWVGVGEVAILEFIPWALAKWFRTWEDPEDNWANVSSKTWWSNLQNGFEYDGDNFLTNNFSHPYHGALFFNAGRTNGYDFWGSSAFSLTGSAVWEFFGETFRPSFNDWIYTGVGGANLGEILYRLSSMVTDNRATGSERVWSEIWGSLLNPVRGFNRAISGEMGQSFDNPEWSRPKNFLITFDGGSRSMDKDGDEHYTSKEVEGLFTLNIAYGNRFKVKKPFDFFGFEFAIASNKPHLTTMNSTGFLFGWELENNKHRFDVSLDFNFNDLIKEEISENDTTYKGFLFGSTQIFPHLSSVFPIGEKTNIITRVGINGMMMAATPNDYYIDVEGRANDFGPGVGTRLYAAVQNGIWNYVSVMYYGAWLWTQSQPDNSKHHIHFLILEAQYPITKYFSIGFSTGVYWRNSYYDSYEGIINGVEYSREASDVFKTHPVGRIFFRTAILDL